MTRPTLLAAGLGLALAGCADTGPSGSLVQTTPDPTHSPTPGPTPSATWQPESTPSASPTPWPTPTPTPTPSGAPTDPDYVADVITLAAPGEGFDLDGDGDIDNAAAVLLPQLAEFIGDPDANIAASIEAGAFLVLIDTTGIDDIFEDDAVRVAVLLGEDTDFDSSDNFVEGEPETFGVRPESYTAGGNPNILIPDATITEGVLSGGPINADFLFPLTPDALVRVVLREARMTGRPSWGGFLDGTLGGAITVRSLQDAISEIPGLPEGADALAGLLLRQTADIDIDGDGNEDALSVAVRFTAVAAHIDFGDE